MKHFTFFILLLLSIQQAFSQETFLLKGKISVIEGDYYYVTILTLQDSAIITYEYFDTPDFEINNIKTSGFIFQITSPFLYKPYSSSAFNEDEKNTIDVGFIQLEPDIRLLDEVTVTGIRPQVKFSEGKLICQIQNNKDFLTLNSLDDILRRLPFITLRDGKINVFGKRNTLVLVNGLPPKNDNWELIPPDDIKEVEVISNPSAEYNSNGMAVVNIITKKNFIEGFNGQLSASVSKGDFWRSNNTLQLGYATEKLNLFSGIGYNPNKRRYLESYERYFSSGEKMFNRINEVRTMPNRNNLIFGLDYLLHPKHTFSAQYQRMYEKPERNTVNNMEAFYPQMPSQQFDVYVKGEVLTKKDIYDVNYFFLIDSLGKKISANIGYVDYEGGEKNDFEILSVGKQDDKRSASKAQINIFTANVDYIHQTKDNFTGKIGLYYSGSQNRSEYELQDRRKDVAVDDIPSENKIRINENKMAAYLTGRKDWDKFYLSAGVRYEYVDYNNKDKRENKVRKIYEDLFPSLEMGYNMNEKIRTHLSFSRKVNYPSFQDLDPTINYVDTFTYNRGNTNLKPEFSYNTSLDIVYNRMITFSLGYSKIHDPINPLFIKRLNPHSLTAIVSVENMERQDTWTASFSFPFQYKFWTMMNAVGVNFNKVKYKSEEKIITMSKAMAYVYSYNSFALPEGFNLSVVYQYNSSGIQGIIYHNKRNIVNVALNKSFMNDQLSLSLQYEDLFKGGKQKGWTEVSEIKIIQNADYETSFLTLSLRYKFGKSMKKYDMKENSKEVLKRIK